MAKKLSPLEQKSSMKVLGDLRKEVQGQLKGKMDGLKKVTVASNSPEGLKKGLDLAKKIAPKAEESTDSMFGEEDEAGEDPLEEASETPEEESSECSPEEMAMSTEELEAHIQKLIELKASKEQE